MDIYCTCPSDSVSRGKAQSLTASLLFSVDHVFQAKDYKPFVSNKINLDHDEHSLIEQSKNYQGISHIARSNIIS